VDVPASEKPRPQSREALISTDGTLATGPAPVSDQLPDSSPWNEMADKAVAKVASAKGAARKTAGKASPHRSPLLVGIIGGGALAVVLLGLAIWWAASGPEPKPEPKQVAALSPAPASSTKAGPPPAKPTSKAGSPTSTPPTASKPAPEPLPMPVPMPVEPTENKPPPSVEGPSIKPLPENKPPAGIAETSAKPPAEAAPARDPEPVLEANKAVLIGKPASGEQLPVELIVRNSFRFRRQNGKESTYWFSLVSKLTQKTDSVAADGSCRFVLRPENLSCRGFDAGLELRTHPVDRGHLFTPDLFQDVEIQWHADRLGNLTAQKVNLDRYKGELPELIRPTAERLRLCLEPLAVPLPAGEVVPGQSWKATRKAFIGWPGMGEPAVPAARHIASLQLHYTYQGTWIRHGRSEGIIAITGDLLGANGNGKEGTVSGQAVVDLATAKTVAVSLSIDGEFPSPYGLGAVGSIELRLRRSATGEPLVDDKELEGRWRVTKLEVNGQSKLGADQRIYWEFTGERIDKTYPDQKFSSGYRIDPLQKPKVFEHRMVMGEDFDPGMYMLEGDTLTLCFGVSGFPKPKEFASPPGSHFTLVVLQREKSRKVVPLAPLKPGGGITPIDESLVFVPDLPNKSPPSVPVAAEPRVVGRTEVLHLLGHSGQVTSVAFSPDGSRALSASKDRTVRLWDLANGKELQRLNGHTDAVEAVVFFPDGKRALSGSVDRTARIWDLEGGQQLRFFGGHLDEVRCVALSPNARYGLSAGADPVIRLWEVETGRQFKPPGGHALPTCTVAFSADGRSALSAGWDGKVRLWDLEKGKLPRQFSGGDAPLRGAAWSADGRRIVAASSDKSIWVWSVETGKVVRQLRANEGLNAVAFTPSGRLVLAGGDKGHVLLWDVDSGKQLPALDIKCGRVLTLSISPGGGRLLIGGADNSVRLWQMP
jgi:uncharacterized protein (TIGR03067 family)